jgi:hypothetical protein
MKVLSASRLDACRHLRLQTVSAAAAVWQEHRLLVALVATYIGIGGAVLIALGRPYPFRLVYPLFSSVWLEGGMAYVFLQWARSPARFRAAVRPERIAGPLVVGLLFVPFEVTFVSLKMAIGHVIGFPWDHALGRVDEVLHAGPAWHLVWPIVSRRWLLEATSMVYQAYWTVVLFLVLLWLAWTRDRILRQRGLLTIILVWILGGTVCAWLFASAGPIFSSEPQYRALAEQFERIGFGFIELQRGHMAAQQAQIWGPYAGVSAFPSMHVGVAVALAIIVTARTRRLGAAVWIYAGFIQVWSVVLGWHYAIDGYAGALLAWGCWWTTGRVIARDEAAS